MRLIGLSRSPFVRRTAIGLKLMGFDFEHEQISAYGDASRFARINPVMKAPSLVLDDGTVLVESGVILDYFERRPDKTRGLLPDGDANLVRSARIVGFSLAAADKVNLLIYDLYSRPAELHDHRGRERWQTQVRAALDILTDALNPMPDWLFGDDLMLADITLACLMAMLHRGLPDLADEAHYPDLHAFWRRAEELPEFRALPPG